MVARGPRPEHRRGTSGRRWVNYRKAKVVAATNCFKCGVVFNTTAKCAHPSHAKMPGCPTHPDYPTLEHTHALVRGGLPLDPDAKVSCFHCNSSGGAALRRTRKRTPAPLTW